MAAWPTTNRVAPDSIGARYYEPNQGRFTTPDWSAEPEAIPYANLANPQSLNLYSYVLNNPATATDPDGHICCWGFIRKAWGYLTNLQPGDGFPSWAMGAGTAATGAMGTDAITGVTTVEGTSAVGITGPLGWVLALTVGQTGGDPEILAREKQEAARAKTGTSDAQASDKSGAQDRKLSGGEIDELQGAGIDVHSLKGKGGGKLDLYKDPQGNVYVKPKGASGRGEPTGININNIGKGQG